MTITARKFTGILGQFVVSSILTYIAIFVIFSLFDHRFSFSWFHVELALAINLAGEGSRAISGYLRGRRQFHGVDPL